MKANVRHCIQIFITLFCFAPYSLGTEVVVQQGDTLSQVFYRQYQMSLYRKKNWIQKIGQSNPQMKRPDLIFPGQILNLDIGLSQSLSHADTPSTASLRTVASNADEMSQAPKAEPMMSPVQLRAQQQASPLTAPSVTATTSELVAAHQTSAFGVKAGFEAFRVQAKDPISGSESVFLSNLSPQVRLNWDYFDQDWIYTSQLSLKAYDLLNDEKNPSFTMERQKDSRLGFSLGAARSWAETQKTGLNFIYQEQMFFHALSASQLSADRVGTFGIKFEHEMSVLQIRKAKAGLQFSGELLMPSKGPGYSTASGWGSDLQLFFRYPARYWMMETSAYYGFANQNSDLADQVESHFGILWGITWHFDE